jgi:hypothetical protein
VKKYKISMSVQLPDAAKVNALFDELQKMKQAADMKIKFEKIEFAEEKVQ